MNRFPLCLTTLMLIVLCSIQVNAQLSNKFDSRNDHFQYGFGIKATLELGTRHFTSAVSRDPVPPSINFAANAGVASDFLGDWSHPSVNLEFRLFSRGMGSGRIRTDKKQAPFTFEAIGSLTMTAGIRNRFNQTNLGFWEQHFVPLSYFSDVIEPALQNPFQSSISLGTNYVVSSDKMRQAQRVGFLGLNFARTIQFTYYNDGGPLMSDLGLGDGKDRNYTGGGFFAYTGRQNTLISSIKIGYQKFTGYSLNAFEAANKMSLAYVDYSNSDQANYNKSLYYISATSLRLGLQMSLKGYNSNKFDGQHFIHWQTAAGFHLVPDQSHYALSVSYFRGFSKYGIK